jgi:hypothetical protein
MKIILIKRMPEENKGWKKVRNRGSKIEGRRKEESKVAERE